MKQTHHNDPIHATSANVIHGAIAARAYELWENDGRPENQAQANWLKAEAEWVTGRRRPRAEAVVPPVTS